MNKILFPLLFAIASAFPADAEDSLLTLSDKGVLIEAPGVGQIVLGPPILSLHQEDYEGQKPQVTLEDDTLVCRYESGTELRIHLEQNQIAVESTGIPPNARGFQFRTPIPLDLNRGGKFRFDDKPLQDIPAEQTEQFLFHGEAGRFAIVNAQGEGIAFTAPIGWHQLQDNRFFNWPVYEHVYIHDLREPAGQGGFQIQVEAVK